MSIICAASPTPTDSHCISKDWFESGLAYALPGRVARKVLFATSSFSAVSQDLSRGFEDVHSLTACLSTGGRTLAEQTAAPRPRSSATHAGFENEVDSVADVNSPDGVVSRMAWVLDSVMGSLGGAL